MSDRNPWGISPGAAKVLDAYVLHGSAPVPGINQDTLASTVHRALSRMPEAPRLHRLMWWRDYRGLVPSPEWPALPPAIPFGLTERQAQVWDLLVEGANQADIAADLGLRHSTVHGLIERGARLIPGEREGNKQAAWRRARCTD